MKNKADALIKKTRPSSRGAWENQRPAHGLHKKKGNSEEQTGTRLSRLWNPKQENKAGYVRSDQDALLTAGDLKGANQNL
jgi:hypothetical protein